MNKIDLIIDALEGMCGDRCNTEYNLCQASVALAAARELQQELAKPEPVVSFTDNDEGLCIQLACNGSYHWQNLSENEAAEFFVNAYRGRK